MAGWLRFNRDHPLRQQWRRFRFAHVRPWQLKRAAKAREKLAGPVVAVTGSSGKSTTCALLSHMLGAKGAVRSQVFANTIDEIPKTFLRGSKTQDFTIVELGVGAVGDMAPMAGAVSPDMAIVTMIQLEHYSAFRSVHAIAAEKGALVAAVRPNGCVVLNGDDPQVLGFRSLTTARIVTFGIGEECDYRVVKTSGALPDRICVTIQCPRGVFDIQTRFAAPHFSLATAAAFAAAVELGVDPALAARQAAAFEPPYNRCSIADMPGGISFLLDAAKAPWNSLRLPIEAVRAASAPRKTIVLGQISDYGGNPRPKYRDAHAFARDAADRAFYAGDHGHRAHPSAEDVAAGNFRNLYDAKALFEVLNADVVPGELVLLKSSGNLHLERAAIAFESDVRCWKARCPVKGSCLSCGLYPYPPEMHRAVKRKRALMKIWRTLTGRSAPAQRRG